MNENKHSDFNRAQNDVMPQRLIHLERAISIGFTILMMVLVYWSTFRAGAMIERPDNPRRVVAEYNLERGSILDRNGALLANSTGSKGSYVRSYPLSTNSPVGYYSLRYGVSGIESSYDSVLRGATFGWKQVWNELINRSPKGSDVVLTLDLDIQNSAQQLLSDESGAVVVLQANTGEILASVTSPGFNPNTLDIDFEDLASAENAPLIHRAYQASYQPGSALFPLLFAEAFEKSLASPEMAVPKLATSVIAGGVSTGCAIEPGERNDKTLHDAMAFACPQGAAELGELIGAAGIRDMQIRFGLLDAPELPVRTVASQESPTLGNIYAVIDEATGQGNTKISPLQLAWALSTLVNGGTRVPLRLVKSIYHQDHEGLVIPSQDPRHKVIDVITAELVMDVLVEARFMHLPNNSLMEKRKVGLQVAKAITGPEGQSNVWLSALVPPVLPDYKDGYVIVILLESEDDPWRAVSLAEELLDQLLN